MDYLPLSFDLRRQRVLLAGGGGVALRKARWLVRAGARLRVVAPVVEAELEALLDGVEGAELLRREYREGDLEGVVLAVAATSDDGVNAEVARAARRDRIPVNARSEEHTSELQSRGQLVWRLLLEERKNYNLFEINR